MDPCPLAREHFCLTMGFIFSPLVFSPFGGENFLAGLERKNPAPTISFPFPSSQPNTLQEVFTPHFLSLFFFFFFIFPKIHSIKHTIKLDRTKNQERERELFQIEKLVIATNKVGYQGKLKSFHKIETLVDKIKNL